MILVWPEMGLILPELSIVWPEMSLVLPEITVALKSLYIQASLSLVFEQVISPAPATICSTNTLYLSHD